MDANRSMAWCKLEFYMVGMVLFYYSGVRKIDRDTGTVKIKMWKTALSYLYFVDSEFCMGIV